MLVIQQSQQDRWKICWFSVMKTKCCTHYTVTQKWRKLHHNGSTKNNEMVKIHSQYNKNRKFMHFSCNKPFGSQRFRCGDDNSKKVQQSVKMWQQLHETDQKNCDWAVRIPISYMVGLVVNFNWESNHIRLSTQIHYSPEDIMILYSLRHWWHYLINAAGWQLQQRTELL